MNLRHPDACPDRGACLSRGVCKGVRRAHRLQGPGPLDEITAGDVEAKLRMIARQLLAANLLHADASGPIALCDRGRLCEAGLILGYQKVADLSELEWNRSPRQLRIDFSASVQHLDDLFL